jgi:hypothetical protein
MVVRYTTTVVDPHVGDRILCPGCDETVTLTPQDGWGNPGHSCIGDTTHDAWIVTVFSNPAQDNPLPFQEDSKHDEITDLEARLEQASAIAACAIGQPDRAERVADREHIRKKLENARACLDSTS